MKVKIKTPGIIPSQDVEIDVRDNSVICVNGDCFPLTPIIAKGWAEHLLQNPVYMSALDQRMRKELDILTLGIIPEEEVTLEALAILVGKGVDKDIVKNVEDSGPSFPIILTSDDPEDCLP